MERHRNRRLPCRLPRCGGPLGVSRQDRPHLPILNRERRMASRPRPVCLSRAYIGTPPMAFESGTSDLVIVGPNGARRARSDDTPEISLTALTVGTTTKEGEMKAE